MRDTEEQPSIYVKDIQPTATRGHSEVRFMCLPGNVEIALALQITIPEGDSKELNPSQWGILADQLRGWQTIAKNQGKDSQSTRLLWPSLALRVQSNETQENEIPRAHLVLLPTQTRIPLNDYIDRQYDGGPDVPKHVWKHLAHRLGGWYTAARAKSFHNPDEHQPRAGFL